MVLCCGRTPADEVVVKCLYPICVLFKNFFSHAYVYLKLLVSNINLTSLACRDDEVGAGESWCCNVGTIVVLDCEDVSWRLGLDVVGLVRNEF